MEILNEVYFGKKPIIPLQKQLSALRKKLANKPVTSKTNLDPEILKFNRLTENVFGFKTFALYIQPNNIPNAYAFPVDVFYSPKEKQLIFNSLATSPTGFKYSEAFTQVSLVIAVHSGLLNNDSFTDEEIMACILHEIGHGFFIAVTDQDQRYSLARKFTDILNSIFSFVTDKLHKGKSFTMDAVQNELSSMSGTIDDVKKVLKTISPRLFKESMHDNLYGSMLQYTNEKFADTFAAMYGYGEEVHSMVTKIHKYVYDNSQGVKTVPKIVEIMSVFNLLIKDMIALMLDIKDSHPAVLARMQTTVDYIKRELGKDSIDPKVKNELLKELAKSEKLIQNYINFPKDQDSMRILRVYYTFLWKRFGGDLREPHADNDALFQVIDDRYNYLRKARYHTNVLK